MLPAAGVAHGSSDGPAPPTAAEAAAAAEATAAARVTLVTLAVA